MVKNNNFRKKGYLMNLRKNVFSIVLVLSLLVSGLFGSLPNATAQTQVSNESTYQDVDVTENPRKTQIIKDLANDTISNGQMILNYSNAKLDFDNVKLLEINDDKNKYTSITIPVVGDQYSLLSNLSLVFDSNNKLVTYSETLITRSDDNKFIVSSYADGSLLQEQFTDLDYVSNDELQRQLDYLLEVLEENKQDVSTNGIPEIALCLSVVIGVDLVIARLIATTCVASCPAVPPVCAVCITAVSAIGIANMPLLLACFEK